MRLLLAKKFCHSSCLKKSCFFNINIETLVSIAYLVPTPIPLNFKVYFDVSNYIE